MEVGKSENGNGGIGIGELSSEGVVVAERVFGMKLPNYRDLKRDIFGRLKDVAVFSKQLVFLIEQAKDEKDARRH